ncbi:MAG: substrate-binding domain-containing protein [Anaerolineaceae bacterium]|nr:substrate-binding domain-containing protein [Anaerolineaceae bacterium]
MNKKPLTRRDFLRIAGVTVGAAGLAACTSPTPAATVPTAPQASTGVKSTGPVVLKVMCPSNEFTVEQRTQFEDTHPNIKINFLENDLTALIAMFAAGNPPDLFRLSAPILPRYLVSKLVTDLEPYIANSKVIKKDDLAPGHVLLKYDGKNTGNGDLYGIIKDWSPEFSLWVNTAAFEKAGVPVPADDKPLAYTEVMDIARKLTVKQGDRTLQWGFGTQAMTWGWTHTLIASLGQIGQNLYSPDFKKMVLVDNPEAVKIIKYWFDMAKEDLTPNPLDPTSTWEGDEFTKGKIAMAQYGFWFSAQAESDVTKGKVMMLPAPDWGGKEHRDPCAAATCTSMCSQTKNPEAAWEWIEWYHGKEPAIARAKQGWGVPGLKSLYNLMPKETPYQQQCQKVLAAEMKVSTYPMPFNPYYDSESTNNNVWKTNLEQGLRGTLSFDDMVKNIEKDNNDAISVGISIVS